MPSPAEQVEQRCRQAAKDLAQWELGYGYWADRILWAYNHPGEAEEYLRAEGFYD